MKLIVALTSTAAALLLGAGIYSVSTEKDRPAGIVTESDDNPFAGLDRALADLEADLQSEMADEEIEAEEDYLGISLSPKPEPAAADRDKSTTQNVPYRSCVKDPYVANRAVFLRGTPDASAKRAIYMYVSARRTQESQDCSCAGKIAPFDEVFEIIEEIEKEQGPDWNRYVAIKDYNQKFEDMEPEIEAFCGGEF